MRTKDENVALVKFDYVQEACRLIRGAGLRLIVAAAFVVVIVISDVVTRTGDSFNLTIY